MCRVVVKTDKQRLLIRSNATIRKTDFARQVVEYSERKNKLSGFGVICNLNNAVWQFCAKWLHKTSDVAMPPNEKS